MSTNDLNAKQSSPLPWTVPYVSADEPVLPPKVWRVGDMETDNGKLREEYEHACAKNRELQELLDEVNTALDHSLITILEKNKVLEGASKELDAEHESLNHANDKLQTEIKFRLRESTRADAWVRAARSLARDLGLSEEDSSSSTKDWGLIERTVHEFVRLHGSFAARKL